MAKIIESTIERGLYILLLLTFLIAIGTFGVAYASLRSLRAQQTDFHNQSALDLATIENNQVAQTNSLKQSFICLVNISPTSTDQKQEAINCLDSVPGVSK